MAGGGRESHVWPLHAPRQSNSCRRDSLLELFHIIVLALFALLFLLARAFLDVVAIGVWDEEVLSTGVICELTEFRMSCVRFQDFLQKQELQTNYEEQQTKGSIGAA